MEQIKATSYKSYTSEVTVGRIKYIMENLISATDFQQNDLTAQVQIDTNLSFDKPGIYEVHYRVSDAFERKGHAILTVIVEE